MHLLISMMENELKVKKLKPKYACMITVRRSLRRVLNHRNDKDWIIKSISQMINDDINRLELSVYVDAYSRGYQDDVWVNRLESYALKNIAVEELYTKSCLFHYSKSPQIMKLRSELVESIDIDHEVDDALKRITFTYCERVIKKKLYRINEHLDRQLMINYDNLNQIVHDEEVLTITELTKIYQKIMTSYIKSILRIYRNAYWYGVNDKVLNRY